MSNDPARSAGASLRRELWRRARTLASSGEATAALALLVAHFDTGGWFAPDRLLGEDDLATIRELPGFASLLDEAASRRAAATAASRASLTLIRPSSPPPWPVLLALHGNEQTVADAVPHWAGASDHGWLVALPQAGTPSGPQSYVWAAATTGEIVRHTGTLRDLGAATTTVVGGSGRGGYHALRLTVAGIVQAAAVLVVSPSMNDIDELKDAMPEAAARGLCVTFVYGMQDAVASKAVATVAPQLRDAGVRVFEHAHDGHAHGFPPGFADSLPRLLDEALDGTQDGTQDGAPE